MEQGVGANSESSWCGIGPAGSEQIVAKITGDAIADFLRIALLLVERKSERVTGLGVPKITTT